MWVTVVAFSREARGAILLDALVSRSGVFHVKKAAFLIFIRCSLHSLGDTLHSFRASRYGSILIRQREWDATSVREEVVVSGRQAVVMPTWAGIFVEAATF